MGVVIKFSSTFILDKENYFIISFTPLVLTFKYEEYSISKTKKI